MYCENCRKRVVIYGVSGGAASEKELSRLKATLEKKEAIVLFNPPPSKEYFCPVCKKKMTGEGGACARAHTQ